MATDSKTTEPVWILDQPETDVQMEHLNGVPWWEAPRPRRFHRCTPQSRGWFNFLTHYERCACGAARRDGRGWMERNSRRSS